MTVLQDSYKPRPRENKNLPVLNTLDIYQRIQRCLS